MWKFYFVECWIFLYSYEDSWFSFWDAIKFLQNRDSFRYCFFDLFGEFRAVVHQWLINSHCWEKTFWNIPMNIHKLCFFLNLAGVILVWAPWATLILSEASSSGSLNFSTLCAYQYSAEYSRRTFWRSLEFCPCGSLIFNTPFWKC